MSLLKHGSRGPEVVTLQQRLNSQLFPGPNLHADGIFGPLTKKIRCRVSASIRAFSGRCIVAQAGTKWCTAHEVCHVLLGSSFNPVHIVDTKNL